MTISTSLFTPHNLTNLVIMLESEQVKAVEALFVAISNGDRILSSMLARLAYWSPKSVKGGWVYKSHRDWDAECGITQGQIRRIHKEKKLEKFGFIRKLMKANGAPTTHYILAYPEQLVEKIATFLNMTDHELLTKLHEAQHFSYEEFMRQKAEAKQKAEEEKAALSGQSNQNQSERQSRSESRGRSENRSESRSKKNQDSNKKSEQSKDLVEAFKRMLERQYEQHIQKEQEMIARGETPPTEAEIMAGLKKARLQRYLPSLRIFKNANMNLCYLEDVLGLDLAKMPTMQLETFNRIWASLERENVGRYLREGQEKGIDLRDLIEGALYELPARLVVHEMARRVEDPSCELSEDYQKLFAEQLAEYRELSSSPPE